MGRHLPMKRKHIKQKVEGVNGRKDMKKGRETENLKKHQRTLRDIKKRYNRK